MNSVDSPSHCAIDHDVSSPRPAVGVIQLLPFTGESGESLALRLVQTLRDANLFPLLTLAFGTLENEGRFREALASHPSAIPWPVQWVQGMPCEGRGMVGLQTYVLPLSMASGVRTLVLGHRAVGSCFEDDYSRHLLLGGLGASDISLDAATQTEETFRMLASLLMTEGMAFSDIVRTWFYNDAILAWYPNFNRVRNDFYSHVAFNHGALPASTAVAGRNSAGSALQLAVWATRPKVPGLRVAFEVKSPLQCAATDYGSAFSRAVELNVFGARQVFVSGTASIEPGGSTVHIGDAMAQIELSLDVVEALLRTRNMAIHEASRVIAYCKYPEVSSVLGNCLANRGLQDLPMLRMHCDICRDDLLFEIELDVVG